MNNHIENPETAAYQEASELVSLEKLFGLLEVEPTPMQRQIIDLYDNRLKEWSELNLVASRRSGKTFTLAIMAILDLLKPNSSVILVSKSAKSLANNFNEIVKMLKMLGIKIDKLNTQQYQLTILGNSHLKASVAKQTENLLGARASVIMLDECGVYPYADFMELHLAPMRLDYSSYENNTFVSKIVRVSSPRAIGSDFHIDTERGLPPLNKRHLYKRNDGTIFNQCVTLNYNVYDSPLLTPTLIESIKATTTEDVWRTEYLGEFIHENATRAFHAFSEARNTYDRKELFEKLKDSPPIPLFIGVDIGLVDQSAYIAGIVVENALYVIGTFSANQMTTERIAETLQEMIRAPAGDIPLPFETSIEDGACYVDPAAALTRFDLAEKYDIENLPAFNRIKWGLDTVNELFKKQKLWLPFDTPNLIGQVNTLAFKESLTQNPSAQGDPFIRVKGHHFDEAQSLRYLVASLARYWGIPETNT